MRALTLLAVVVLLGGAWVWAQEALPLARIEVEGNVHVARDEIVVASGLKVGEAADADRVRKAREAIEAMGYFDRVTPRMNVENDQIVVRFTVVEYPRIERITLLGVPEIETGTLWAVIRSWFAGGAQVSESRIRSILNDHDVRVGRVLNAVNLRKALEAVLKEYEERGIATAQVGQVQPGADLIIEMVVLPIVEHRISGLRTVPDEEALALIEVPVGTPGRISDFQASGRKLMGSVYFSSVDVVPEMAPDGIRLTWVLEERTLLTEGATGVRSIQLEGVESLPYERVADRLGRLPQGEITNYDALRAIRPVFDYYRREGFFMLALEGVVDGDVLRVRLREGVLSEIEVKGTTRTEEWVIRRIMGLHEGQVLTQGRLSRAQQALMALGYFEDVSLLPAWREDGVALSTTVKEMERLGSIRGAMTYSPKEKGIVGNLEYAQRNLLGTAQDLSISLERGIAGAKATTWSLGYKGHAFPVYNLVEADLYRRADPGRGLLTLGGEGALSYPLAPYINLRFTLLSEASWELDEERVPLDPRTAVRVGLNYSDRDSFLFPRRGWHAGVSVEKAGTFAPGVTYLSTRAEVARYSPIDVDTAIWEGRAALAQRLLLRVGWDLPERYRFPLGGVDSVRGAKVDMVDRMALLNTEVRFELAPGFGLAGFWDVGTSLSADVPPKSSVGFELTAYIAGMYVRLVTAWPSDRPASWVPVFEFAMNPLF